MKGKGEETFLPAKMELENSSTVSHHFETGFRIWFLNKFHCKIELIIKVARS